MRAIPALLCLLLGTTAAFAALTTVDVGASAVNGEWRPGSCDDVKDGVVLTNIGDNIRAVIEGCGIHVDAGTDPTLSAVSVSSIGGNSTVVLLGCNISATFVTSSADKLNRHGAVRLESNSIIGSDSAIIVDQTVLVMEESGTGKYGAGILFDSNLAVSSNFQLTVSSSVLTVSCRNLCNAIYEEGDVGLSTTSTFADDLNITVFNSTITTSSDTDGTGITVSPSTQLGHRATIAVVACDVTVRGEYGITIEFTTSGVHMAMLIDSTSVALVGKASSQRASAAYVKGKPGHHSSLTVRDSNLTIPNPTRRTTAQALNIRVGTGFGTADNVSMVVLRSKLVAAGERQSIALVVAANLRRTAKIIVDQSALIAVATESTAKGIGAFLQLFIPSYPSTVRFSQTTVTAEGRETTYGLSLSNGFSGLKGGTVTVDGCEVSAVSALKDAAAVAVLSPLESVAVTISASTLRFLSKSFYTHSPGSALAVATLTHGSVTVSSTRLVADAGSADNELFFVAWTKDIGGAPRHALDNVTFEVPDSLTVEPFRAVGLRPTNAVLCLRDIVWANGTAIDSRPALFKTSKTCWPRTPTPAITPTATVAPTTTATQTRTPPATSSPSLLTTLTQSSSLSAPPTVTATPRMTTSPTVSGSSQVSRTVSLPATPSTTSSPSLSRPPTPTSAPTPSSTPSASFTTSHYSSATATVPQTMTMPTTLTMTPGLTGSPTFSTTQGLTLSVSAPLTHSTQRTGTVTPTKTPALLRTRTPSRTVKVTPPMTPSPTVSGSNQVSRTFSPPATPSTTSSPSLTRPPTSTAPPTPTAAPTTSPTLPPTPSPSSTVSRSPTATATLPRTATKPTTLTVTPGLTVTTTPTLSPTFSATQGLTLSVSALLTQTTQPTITAPPTATPAVQRTRSPSPSVTTTPPVTPAAPSSHRVTTSTPPHQPSSTVSAAKPSPPVTSSFTATVAPPMPPPIASSSSAQSSRAMSSSSTAAAVSTSAQSNSASDGAFSSSSISSSHAGGSSSSRDHASASSSTGSGFQIGGRVTAGGNAANSNAVVWAGVGAALAVMLAAVAAAGFGVWLWRRSKHAEPPLAPVVPGPALCDKEWRGQSLSTQRKSMATEDGLAIGGSDADECEGKAALEDSVNNPFATEEDVETP